MSGSNQSFAMQQLGIKICKVAKISTDQDEEELLACFAELRLQAEAALSFKKEAELQHAQAKDGFSQFQRAQKELERALKSHDDEFRARRVFEEKSKLAETHAGRLKDALLTLPFPATVQRDPSTYACWWEQFRELVTGVRMKCAAFTAPEKPGESWACGCGMSNAHFDKSCHHCGADYPGRPKHEKPASEKHTAEQQRVVRMRSVFSMFKVICDLCWYLAWKTPLRRWDCIRDWGTVMWNRGRWSQVKLTCESCNEPDCPFRGDRYNTNGDCLAEK